MRPSDLPEVAWPVAFDTETSGTHPDDGARVSVVSVAWIEQDGHEQAYAFPFDQERQRDKTGKFEQPSLWGGEDPNLGLGEWRALLEWLARRRLVAHGSKYDVLMTETGTRHWIGDDLEDNVVWDTLLAQRELDPLHSASLEDVAVRLGLGEQGEVGSEAELKKALKRNKLTGENRRYDLLPWDDLEPYARRDALVTIRLFWNQITRLETGEACWWWVQRELNLMRVLLNMERRGIAYNWRKSKQVARELEKAADSLWRKMPFDGRNDAATKRWFFEKKGMEPPKRTDTGAPSLDQEALGKLAKSGVEWAAELGELRLLDRAVSMWYDAYADMTGWDGRLRTVYQQSRMVNPRISSTRVNLQAIPHDYRLSEKAPSVRSMFYARKGHWLLEMDLGQVELRVAAVMAGCERMLQMIREGADMHGETAKLLWPGVYEEREDWFEKRQLAKRGNFSLIFGVGPTRFQEIVVGEGYDMPYKEAERLVYNWRDIYPEFPRANRRESKKAGRCGYTRLINGKVRFYPQSHIHGGEVSEGFNTKVQASVAEVVKDWIIEVDDIWPDRLVLEVHDSLALEWPYDEPVDSLVYVTERLFSNWFGVHIPAEVKEWV